jgi:hypothetical protein
MSKIRNFVKVENFDTWHLQGKNIHFRGKGHSDMRVPELFQGSVVAVTTSQKAQLADLDELLR